MKPGIAASGALFIFCALTGVAHAQSAAVDLIHMIPESVDEVSDATVSVYFTPVRHRRIAPWLREAMAAPSMIRIRALDLTDPLIDFDARVFADDDRRIAITARAFDIADAPAGLAVSALEGYDDFWPTWTHLMEYGRFWTAGIEIHPAPGTMIAIPLLTGTLDDSSPAESFEDDLTWIQFRTILNQSSFPLEVTAAVHLDEFMDHYEAGVWLYPTDMYRIGMKAWMTEDDGLEISGLYAGLALGEITLDVAVLHSHSNELTDVRLVAGARF